MANRNYTSLLFTWDVPKNPHGIISKYKIQCCRVGCKEQIINDNILPAIRSAWVEGLAANTVYYCTVRNILFIFIMLSLSMEGGVSYLFCFHSQWRDEFHSYYDFNPIGGKSDKV